MMSMKLGDGPAIKIKDGGLLADPNVIAWMEETAEKENIKTTERNSSLWWHRCSCNADKP